MAGRAGRWVLNRPLTADEKATISATCGRFITGALKPRHLPVVRPTAFNYPVDILGKWRGSRYSFIVRYRSGFAENAGGEFDTAFARLDHVEEHPGDRRFDVMWHRHTGQWFRLYSLVRLDAAPSLIESEELLWPL